MSPVYFCWIHFVKREKIWNRWIINKHCCKLNIVWQDRKNNILCLSNSKKARVFIKVFGWEDKSIKTCIYSVYINRIKKAFWKKSVGQLLHDENCFSSDTQWMLTSTNLLLTRTPLGTPLWSAKPGGTSKPNSKRGRPCHIT